ncbi:NACHT domain-containing protein [Actinophytocola sediminis]
MSGIETAAIALGTALTKLACDMWLGKDTVAGTVGSNVIDVVTERFTNTRHRRQFRRVWEQMAELVADRVEPLASSEFRNLPEYERLAAIDAVRDTLDVVALTDADIYALDLDAGFLNRYVRGQDRDRGRRAGLSADATALYDLVLRESCAYLIELVRALPRSNVTGMAELLRRERQVIEDVRTVLERLPQRRSGEDFDHDYRQLVANRLDSIGVFGATLSERSRRYPLSIAYLNLTVSGDFSLRRPDGSFEPGPGSRRTNARVNSVLASTRRLLVRGQAGLGKTTLLQWIAVHSARRSFSDTLRDWNDTIPFFVSLRRHSDGRLPAPEHFLSEAGRHIAAEMPPGWVHRQLRDGRAVVLVDGVDELPESRRDDVRQWLSDLTATFPAARFVVTSRPAAAPTDWLDQDDFVVAELEPMSFGEVDLFITRWHDAMRELCLSTDEHAVLNQHQRSLLSALRASSHLRALAGYPLLCALLCALQHDRRGELPDSRLELYEVALHMLLERRDSERGIPTRTRLSRTSSMLILQEIAYWLMRNDWTTAPTNRVRERIRAKLFAMPQITTTAEKVYQDLLERSGLIREPVTGQTDFVHRSFQEYLAAAEAVASDDIGVLIANAHRDLWTDVVVMAAGQAPTARRVELLTGILARSQDAIEPDQNAHLLRLLALAGLEISPEVPPELAEQIKRAATTVLPPRTMAAARSLVRAGHLALDLLREVTPVTVKETAATIRALTDIGDPAGLPLIAKFGHTPRRQVFRELMRGWPRFDPHDYAQHVLSDIQLPGGKLDIDNPELTTALGHLRTLRYLYCGYETSDHGLEFLTTTPQLTDLHTQDRSITDLHPVADANLHTLAFYSTGLNDQPLSLAPLQSAHSLRTIRIWARPVSAVGALVRLPRLERVRLDYLMSMDALTELSMLTDLSELGIGHLTDLTNLDHLHFLRAPSSIGINACPINDDLAGLSRWSASLASLSLRDLHNLNLRPLTTLSNLTYLDVQGSSVRNLHALGALECLTSIDLSYNQADLFELHAIPSLRHITITGADDSGIDLTPLAGITDVTISTLPGVAIHGDTLLGPGSKVRR